MSSLKTGQLTSHGTPSLEALSVPGSSDRAHVTEWRFSTRGAAILLFITCWAIFTLHFATNTVREIYPALTLGDHLSFDVSEYAGLHPDIFEIPGRGSFINNNPGASILGAIPYALARPVTDRIVEYVQRRRAASPDSAPPEYDTVYPMAREFYREARARGLDVKLGLAAAIMQSLCMAPLSALGAVVMFYVLLNLTGSPRQSVLLAVLYSVATPVLYRTAQLNQNMLVADFALFGFALLWRPWDDPVSPRRPRYLLAGLCSGWAVVLDYSGLVVLLGLSLYGLARRASLPAALKSRADILYFCGGVAFCAAVLMAYQWSCFGSPFYPAQQYMPAVSYTGYGLRGFDWPHLDLFWQTAFDARFGLFTSAPLLLLALYVPGWFGKGASLIGRREAWFILIFSVAFFLFCSANQYGRMQFNSGVRHIVPVVPFLFLVVAGMILRLPRIIAVVVGVVSAYWSWCLAMYRDVELGRGIIESPIHITLGGPRLPWLVTLEKMGYVQTGLLTLAVLASCTAMLWLLWTIGKRGRRVIPQRLVTSSSAGGYAG